MLDHIAFVVEDVEKTAAFLAKFGYEVFRRTAHHSGAIELNHPQQPGIILELTTKRPQDTLGFNHVCMRVADQSDCDKLAAEGVVFTGVPHLSPDTGRYLTNTVDENGIKWQITF